MFNDVRVCVLRGVCACVRVCQQVRVCVCVCSRCLCECACHKQKILATTLPDELEVRKF